MTNLLPHNELHYYIEHAWREIQHDPHHRMRIHTRLHIYDLLVQDLGVPMYELAVTNKLSFFPKLTQGLYRYVYLGFQTVTPLIPIWEHEIKRQLTVNPDFEPDWSFPSIILDASYELLAGKTEDEVETFLEQKQTYWTDIRHWDQMVGNITEFIPYTPRMCLNAVYKVHSAVYGLPPI